jgi:UDP-N-acetylglucosamine diphosphorylase / glucose-1-phosphate thymidylyltransferase / UDP-N-acetylgalactosamine diphosphorylase / glucosamine-1-phosphate N-acetyltransferase / galactosamine-1-phosphate N-acetyltransferase
LKPMPQNESINHMPPSVSIAEFITAFRKAMFIPWHDLRPWELTSQSTTVVRTLLEELSLSEYLIADEIAVHRSARVESGSVLKGPIIVGTNGFIAAGAYLRGGALDFDSL